MRIAYLCRSLPLHRQGGLEWHAWDLARGLARRGHQVRIVTTPFEPPAKSTALHEQAREANLEFHASGEARGGLYSVGYLREAAEQVAEWARRGEIDLVHSQGFAALFLRRAELGGVPLVVTIHGTWWSETLLDRRARDFFTGWETAKFLWRYRHRLALRPWYARLLRSADALIVDSEFTRDELVRDCRELEGKISVAPLGVDAKRFPIAKLDEGKNGPAGAPETGNRVRPIRLLMLGRLERGKGFDVALRALAGCPGGNWILRIGGEGPERGRLEALAESLGLSAETMSRVEFLGRVPEEEVGGRFAESDLFLNPDLTQPAFGLVALEAMLQGTPVLASRVGAMPEVIGQAGGWLVRAGDVEAWRAVLEGLLAATEGLQALRDQGCRARQSALRRFSLERMIGSVEAVYSRAGTP